MYKDALERAKKIKKKIMYSHLSTESCEAVSEYIDTIIPELAESEEEKMIKAITHILYENYTDAAVIEGVEIAEIVAWLEKQKEQKSESCEPDTNVEKVIEDVIRVYGKTQGEWVGGYDVDTLIVNLRRAFNKKEQHPSSKFHPGDWVVYDGPLGHAILQVKDVVDGRYTFVDNDSTLLEEDGDKYLHPLTPKDVEKKAEWSEEDVDMLNSCISSIEEAKENRYAYKETDGDTSYDHEIAWLKSLRPSWKPSKEQMEVLLSTQDMVRSSGYRQNAKVLASLYERLKKL